MKRRRFVITATTFAVLGGCGVLPNLSKPAAPHTARVGILDASALDDAAATNEIAGLKQGLAEVGYAEGQSVVFELRDSAGNAELLQKLANELIQLPVDVLVSLSGPATRAARQATTILPIVFLGTNDPVGDGFVASLGHPGGNVTGATGGPPTTFAKDLEILAQLVPGLSRVAIVVNLDPVESMVVRLQAVMPAAKALGVQLKILDVRSADDVQPALTAAHGWQAEAMMSFGGPGAVTDATPRLVDFQVQNRMPMAFSVKEQVQGGGLLCYSPSYDGLGRVAATLVDKIIKGSQPADLPVEQPTVYELVVNQTTAQTLGISIPPEVAQQVTEWIRAP